MDFNFTFQNLVLHGVGENVFFQLMNGGKCVFFVGSAVQNVENLKCFKR